METKFITKWALTDGIVERWVNKIHADNPYYGCKRYEDDRWEVEMPKKHIHDTPEQAKAHAEQMRLAEIEKLQSKLTKLQELKF